MRQRGGFQKALSIIGRAIPGERLKTSVYLNAILKPRRVLRDAVTEFYRMDHIYEVIREFDTLYEGPFSILEFGVADGYAFTKKLYAARHLGAEEKFTVHGFDTFEGLPAPESEGDQALLGGDAWAEGTYAGDYDALQDYCMRRYPMGRLHKGRFDETLSPELLAELTIHKPALIWIDCDLYTSTRSVFEVLIPYIPTGCVVYFDDIYFNFSSHFTGEMRVVHEINAGAFGPGIELVRDRKLSWNTDRVWRFISMHGDTRHTLKDPGDPDRLRRRGDDSPFP